MAEKTYYLRQGNRITGPFPMLKLTAMYRSGLLTYKDMCSEDKSQWHYINMLFPDLIPDVPDVVEPPEPAAAPPDVTVKIAVAPAPEVVPRVTAKEYFLEWVLDIGRTIALLWNFREMLQTYAEKKSTRFYGIALNLHLLLCIIIVPLFGRYYSSKYHDIISPLIGISLLAVLYAAAGAGGWFAAKYCMPAEKKPESSWMCFAAGLYMNYGTIACCIMALAHGFRSLWVVLFLCFINSAVLCSSAMQVRDYLERAGKDWRLPVIGAVLVLNPVLFAIIYCFIILI